MGSIKLSVGDFGDEVTYLHENLKKHGFNVSAEEVKRKFFGSSTREAVGEFQKAHGIDPSCEVCNTTAVHLSSEPAKVIDKARTVSTASFREENANRERVIDPKESADAVAEQVFDTQSIAALAAEKLKSFEEILRSKQFEKELKPSSEGNPASLGDMLNAIPGGRINDAHRKSIATVIKTVSYQTDDFIQEAEKIGLDKTQALLVRQTLQLGDLTLKHLPVIKVLQTAVENNADGSLKSLAAFQPGQWLELAYEHDAPSHSFMTPEQYAEHLDNAVETLLPTEVLLAKLENRVIEFQPAIFSDITGFLKDYPAFDILKSNIDQFAIDANIKPATAAALGKLQHLKRLDMRWDEAEVLVNSGLDSAEKISHYNKEQFTRVLGKNLPEYRLTSIHAQATALKAVSIGLMGYLQPLLYGVSAQVMGRHENLQNAKAQIENNPTLRKLFGALEQCQCDPCLSVLSPAAYLADLLKFVDASPEASVELQRRRPDIYDLELSCENSQIELPYIDLAVEILENAVAFPYSIPLPITPLNIHLPVSTKYPPLRIELPDGELLEGQPVGQLVQKALQETVKDKLGEVTAHQTFFISDLTSSNSNYYYIGDSPIKPKPGAGTWEVKDRYRTWNINVVNESFWYSLNGINSPLEKRGNLYQKLIELANGTVPQSVQQEMFTSLPDLAFGLPATITLEVTRQLSQSDNNNDTEWEINLTGKGKIAASSVIGPNNTSFDSFSLSNFLGQNVLTIGFTGKRKKYFAPTLIELREGRLNARLINLIRASLGKSPVPDDKFLQVTPLDSEDSWQYSINAKVIITYSPASITVTSLSYQSTPTDRDLFARPQNLNPLAYKNLAGWEACFPWSLPFDLPLIETRQTLSVAGVSRLSLLEQSSAASDRYTSKLLAEERLELSSNEWDLIIDAERVLKPDFWKIWGLANASSSQPSTLFDTFIDQNITALPFGKDGLLTRVSIILQQARLSFAELLQLLDCSYITSTQIQILPEHVCKPSELRLSMVTESDLKPVLAKLHRFVRLWRATGWQIWELDLAITQICNGVIDSDEALKHIANLGFLKERLNLPIDVLVAMLGGFSDKRYSVTVKNEVQELIPLYDRLFQNRQLSDPPFQELAFSAKLSDLTDPSKEAIASSVGVRKSDLLTLLKSEHIDGKPPVLHNTEEAKNNLLQWIFRNVALAKVLRLSLSDYERVWGLFGGDSSITSPGKLLEFLDDIDFVNQSGFTWTELEYLFLETEPDQSVNGLPGQHIVELLSTLLQGLRQLIEPEKTKITIDFGITEALLKPNSIPKLPSSEEMRWKRWKLEQNTGNWSVKDPQDLTRHITDSPLELLMRVDVLAQQAGLTIDNLKLALKTKYVEPDQQQSLVIKSQTPFETIRDLKDKHLDRLERFVFLLRASKLSPNELDLMLQAFCKDSSQEPLKWPLEPLVQMGQAVTELSYQLRLPLATVVGWWIKLEDADQLKLAQSLGVNKLDLNRLMTLFQADKKLNALDSPVNLVQFINVIISPKQRIEIVTQQLAQTFSIESATVSELLWNYLHCVDTPNMSAMQYLISESFFQDLIPDKYHENGKFKLEKLTASNEYFILIRLHKIALLLAKWKANLNEIKWSNAQGALQNKSFSGLVFDTLLPSKEVSESLLTNWKKSTKLFQLGHVSLDRTNLIIDYLDAYQKAETQKEAIKEAQQSLEDSFGLPEGIVAFCASKLGIKENSDYLDPLRFDELVRLLGTIQKLGIDKNTLDSLISEKPDLVSTEQARKLLSPRFGDSGWQKALRKISDALRVQQRDRLVNCLLAREGLRDANSLYEHYLIDVEMAPCMNTTRMLQSTAAVQLFVQRCLFNLEQKHNVSPETIARNRWEWMQNYRVWEANRKVFLYPENWLFPEVRDDRTEIFKAFESALTQSEPSYENATKALRNYLDELVDVGQINVISMYEHVEQPKGRSLYLVGRLSKSPNDYFWRKAINFGVSGMRWTGWERIDLDLSVDHVIPFVFEGDFHLAWPLISIIKLPQNDVDEFYEMQMAWAKKSSTGWTKRKTSQTKLPTLIERPINKDIQETFYFTLGKRPDETESIIINIYAQMAIPQQILHPPAQPSAQITTGSRTNSSKVFWSLDYLVQESNVKYSKPKDHVKAISRNEYQLAINGVVKETLKDTVEKAKRIDILPKILDNIYGIINDYSSSLSSSENAELTILVALHIAPLIPLVSVLPYTIIPTLFSITATLILAFPALGEKIDKYLQDPVFRITGNTNDRYFINADEIALPTDRMISFYPAQNQKINSIGITAQGFGKSVDLLFGTNPNLPNGVAPGISLQLKLNILFKVDEDRFYVKTEKPLQMQSVGGFLLRSGESGEWESPLISILGGRTKSLEPLANTKFWSNGYKESVTGRIGLFTPSFSEALWVTSIRSNVTGLNTWYVEEGKHKMLSIAENEKGNYVPPLSSLISTTSSNSNEQSSNNIHNLYPSSYSESILFKNWASLDSLEVLFSATAQSKFKTSWFSVDSINAWIGTSRIKNDPRDNNLLGFDLSIPYSNYNWEVFYYLPIAAAIFLSRQHRFEDARQWFHFVFDPTTNDKSTGRERFWRFLPFRNAQVPDTITQLLEVLANAPANDQRKNEVQEQIAAWLEDPFNPYAIARLRPSAFEWYTVIAYIKNLIDWADQLFRRDTRESINEATLLYVMADQILGPRPEKISDRKGSRPSFSYRSLKALRGDLDDFSNPTNPAWITLADNPLIQEWEEFLKWLAQHGINPQFNWAQFEQLSSVDSRYFCVPPNEKLPELWDTVEDRLFKIRHCQNIEGIIRSLALYEPPIDPELLIRAKAAGLDLADVLADRFAPLPYYRFQILLQKAIEFCGEVKGLGSAILSAIEKKEAEHLALLKSGQEIAMLKLIESIKEEQIKEAQANIDALDKSRSNALKRFEFLQHQLGKDQTTLDSTSAPIVEQSLMTQVQESGSPDGFRSLSLISSEIDQIKYMDLASLFADTAGILKFSAGVTHLIGLYPAAKSSAEAAGFALSATAEGLGTIAGHMTFLEHRSSQMATWQRRRDEWVHQSKMTAEEIRQINKQKIALEIKLTMAKKELENHRKQIEHASSIDDYIRHMKFSSESLYGWMENQLSGLYFSAYQLAYDLAKKAERAYQFELGDSSTSYIQFGHWDGLRKGLLSGERLGQNLRRLESAHLEKNRRELEITKHVSLRQLDPLALMALRKEGKCEFEVPEVLFDLDFPGHYFRRIKTVSVSVPCVVGPYSSVSGTLTLLSSKLRDDYKVSGSYIDTEYKSSYLPTQSIATSSGQNDAGVFELNFRDERFLPFEGAGAISRWQFKLPKDFKAFDYDTISDMILHFRYTARDGGKEFADWASKSTKECLNTLKAYGETDEGLWQLIDLRHDYPAEWQLYNKSASTELVPIEVGSDRFPFILRGQIININGIMRPSLQKNNLEQITNQSTTISLMELDFNGNEAWVVLRYSIL